MKITFFWKKWREQQRHANYHVLDLWKCCFGPPGVWDPWLVNHCCNVSVSFKGTSSLDKKGLSWKGSCWYHFSA